MARIAVEIEEVDDIEDEDGREREGVRATWTECDHVTESLGTGPGSRKRCLALMREECPRSTRHSSNWYFDAEEGD